MTKNNFTQMNNFDLIRLAIESLELQAQTEAENELVSALKYRHNSFKKTFFDVIAVEESHVVGKWIVWAESGKKARDYVRSHTPHISYEQLLDQPLVEDMYEHRAIAMKGTRRF